MNRIFRRFTSKNNVYNDFIYEVKNFAKYNLQFIDSVEIKITNPKTFIFPSSTIYESTIWFTKNDMTIYKKCKSNDIHDLHKKMTEFVKNIIKL